MIGHAQVRQEAEAFFEGASDLKAGAERMEYTLCCLKVEILLARH